ncbi:MAG: hypothetical protein R2707_09380 [Acidimicrobiales bacterium]
MPLFRRGLPARGALLIRVVGLLLVVQLLGAACAGDDDEGDGAADVPISSLDTASTVDGTAGDAVSWWFEAPCGDEPDCRPPRPDDLPASTVELAAGHTDELVLDQPDAILVGGEGTTLGLVEIEAPGVTIVGVEIDTIVILPGGNGAHLEANRIGQLFVNGADDVVVRGNLIRPFDIGPDAIQIKTFDGDQPENLLVEANVIGPQDSDGEIHTDCVQILGGDELRFVRNIVMPCGDKAFQIRSGAGGDIGTVILEGNFILECVEQRAGCEGFHAITWASTETTALVLRHNTIRGSVGISSGGSTIDPGDNFIAVGNIASSLPCTAGTSDNLTVTVEACEGRGVQAEFPEFLDDRPGVGDLRLVDPESVPVAAAPFGPSIDGRPSCAAPRYGASTDC